MNNLTHRSMLGAIKTVLNSDRIRFALSNREDVSPELAQFIQDLEAKKENLRSRESVEKLFSLLELSDEGLATRKGSNKVTLVEAIFQVLHSVAGRDMLTHAALNELQPSVKLRSIANWQKLQKKYLEIRQNLEAQADTVFEFSGVDANDYEGLENWVNNQGWEDFTLDQTNSESWSNMANYFIENQQVAA